jgi:flagellar motor switch protein FliM
MSVLPNIQSLFGDVSASIDRFPTFRTVFERAATACAQECRAFSINLPQLTVASVETGTAAEVFAQHEGAIVTGVLNAGAWNTRLLISARRSAVFSIVEMMLGGDGSQPEYVGKRPFSKIETRIAVAFFERFFKALAASVASVAATQFTLESAANTVDFDPIGGRSAAVFAVKLNLDVLGRGGEILIAVPQPAIASMRRAFSRASVKDASRPDLRWSQQIEREITSASVTLNAVLDERPMRLGEISHFRVGQLLELKATARTLVHLECDGERMVVCQFGKSNDVYTLRVDGFVDRQQEFMNDILSG